VSFAEGTVLEGLSAVLVFMHVFLTLIKFLMRKLSQMLTANRSEEEIKNKLEFRSQVSEKNLCLRRDELRPHGHSDF